MIPIPSDTQLLCIPAWFLFSATMLFPFFVSPFSENRSLRNIFLLVILFHHSISLLSVLNIPIPGTQFDARSFHANSANWIKGNLEIGKDPFEIWIYSSILGLFYRLGEVSLFLGNQVSQLAFVIGGFFFVRLLRHIGNASRIGFILLIWGLLPSHVIFFSVTLREPFQFVFFIATLYFALSYQQNSRFINLVLFFLSGFFMGLFHHSLMVYFLMLVTISIPFFFGPGTNKSHKDMVFMGFSIFFSFAVIFLLNLPGSGIMRYLAKKNPMETINMVREKQISQSTENQRAYNLKVDTTSFFGTVRSLLNMFHAYLFRPFPWHMERWSDFPLIMEALLRTILIVFILVQIMMKRSLSQENSVFLFVYFTLSLMWSMGVTNIGNACRHHVLTNWILFVVAGNLFSLQRTDLISISSPQMVLKR